MEDEVLSRILTKNKSAQFKNLSFLAGIQADITKYDTIAEGNFCAKKFVFTKTLRPTVLFLNHYSCLIKIVHYMKIVHYIDMAFSFSTLSCFN